MSSPSHVTVTLNFIPVEERLPERYTPVLAINKEGEVRNTWLCNNRWGTRDGGFISMDQVTHWAEWPVVKEKK